jgi:hypothetical protein
VTTSEYFEVCVVVGCCRCWKEVHCKVSMITYSSFLFVENGAMVPIFEIVLNGRAFARMRVHQIFPPCSSQQQLHRISHHPTTTSMDIHYLSRSILLLLLSSHPRRHYLFQPLYDAAATAVSTKASKDVLPTVADDDNNLEIATVSTPPNQLNTGRS